MDTQASLIHDSSSTIHRWRSSSLVPVDLSTAPRLERGCLFIIGDVVFVELGGGYHNTAYHCTGLGIHDYLGKQVMKRGSNASFYLLTTYYLVVVTVRYGVTPD